MDSYASILKTAKKRAREHGAETSAIELLMLHFSDLSPSEIYLKYQEAMPETQKKRFIEAVDDFLLRHIPVQYIIGEVTFYGYPIKVDSRVLIPRYETEELVEHVLLRYDAMFPGEAVTTLDVGTGSGCIAIALKLEAPLMKVHATDISRDALDCAKANAHALGAEIEFFLGDLYEPIRENTYDIIVANPPYIPLQEDVNPLIKNNEPHVALFGGNDGLMYYQRLICEAKPYLNRRFLIAFEHGYDQKDPIRQWAEATFPEAIVETIQDMQGKDRMTLIYVSK
ncbi:MAG: peptide chain release factor N(5)-glutamine methyltransferase [Candidatus Izemoplasmatales bacterium]|nr:peptide chain release factor N(5)-glutamine methyltransferase [Candidatus Izemoplasmatales bacterium]